MNQRVALITLGIADLERSKKFYVNGFGWQPLHEDHDTVMYQMNGFILSTWLRDAFDADMNCLTSVNNAAICLAHNVDSAEEVRLVLNRLEQAGGQVLREASAPVHSGMRGYIADPDNHAWEIIWNPMWKTQANGTVLLDLAHR